MKRAWTVFGILVHCTKIWYFECLSIVTQLGQGFCWVKVQGVNWNGTTNKMNMFEHKTQIMLGTLLGNSKLINYKKDICLWMRNKDQAWLESKAHDLRRYEDVFYFKTNIYHWRSKPNEIFDEFESIFYNNGQKFVTLSILDSLRDVAIAVWYGDCGCLVGRSRNNACLRTQSFGSKGNHIIAEWFNSVGIECNLNRHRSDYVVVFTHEGTRVLFNMISTLLPLNRRHLLC